MEVQWLKLCASNAGEWGAGLIPGQGAKIPHAMWCGQKKKVLKGVMSLPLESRFDSKEIKPVKPKGNKL